MPPRARLARFLSAPLRRAYRLLFPYRRPDFARLWANACQKWLVDEAVGRDGTVQASGWLAASAALHSRVEFVVNDRPADRVTFPTPRPDVAVRLPFAEGAAESGFHFQLECPDADRDLVLAVRDRQTGGPLGWDYAPYFVPAASRVGPAPSGNRIARVIGGPSAFNFRLGGWTTFQRLQEAVREATGGALEDYTEVLDWGCGCARVSRYFLALPGVRVTGVDVDPDNVGWCREHLPGGVWEVVPLRPPTHFPAGCFGLAFGISVFTHLREPDQLAWLDELRRVVRPGGLALMTFHGEASIAWVRLTGERFAALHRDGICDQPNPLYDAALAESDYYRDTFHTADYVARVWGGAFDILATRPCFVSHQDLVVMRRRE